MAKLLKHVYTKSWMARLANTVAENYSDFNTHTFIDSVFDQNWAARELKARQRHIAICLEKNIPEAYLDQLNLICKTASTFANYTQVTDAETHRSPLKKQTHTEELGGFETLFFPYFVEEFGPAYPEYYSQNIQALAYLTQYASSEFAIRAFILSEPEKTMQHMLAWAHHENYHVRRLASEGCRPKLPWATALKPFQKNPSLIWPILERLKNDNSLYVRRSVANNINDIAKDHPAQVLDYCQNWLGKTPNTDWLIKHGLRTLLKKGDTQALAMFGFFAPEHIQCTKLQCEPTIRRGEKLYFSFDLSTKEKSLGQCRIEFAIGFMKANGKQTIKVFKLSERHIKQSQIALAKHYYFKPISTRKYYTGEHSLSIIINGKTLSTVYFNLT